jgi:GTPase SAR1 family protein
LFIKKRYTKGIFPKNPGPTIGVEYATKTILLNEG